MKKLYPILILALTLAMINFSCKKDDDKDDVNVPSVSISSPLEGSQYNVFDTIVVTVTVSSDKIINSLTISLNDANGTPVGEGVSTNPSQANFTATDMLIINESGLSAGDYKVIVRASDGSNFGIASVNVYVEAIQKRYKGLLVVSQQNTLKTIISLLDTANNLNVVKNLNFGYAASAVSNYWQQFLISSPSPSTLYSYKMSDFSDEWQYNPPSPYPEIPSLHTTYKNTYAGIANGAFIEFNAAGSPLVNGQANLNRIPLKIYKFNDYILMDNAQRDDPKHILTSSYAVSGALFSQREVDFEVVGFGAINNDQVVIFANQNDNAIIKIYDVMNDKLEDGAFVPLGKFYDMVSVSSDRFLVSHDNGILLYESVSDVISIYIPSMSVKKLEFNTIDSIIYAAKDTVITLYNYSTGGILDFVKSPYQIRDIHAFYNR